MSEGMSVGSISYEVEADTSQLVNSATKVDDSLDRMQQAMGKTDSSAGKLNTKMDKVAQAAKNFGRETDTASSSLDGFTRVIAGFLTLQGARAISGMSDAWTELQNRLRLVTTNQDELNKATNDLFAIAQQTSQSIESVGTVYQRFAQNADSLGLSLDDVAAISGTVSKAVAISGASAQGADAALTQLGQALASGTLRGEEFNAIMEQTPGLAQALADGLGVPLGQLRALSQEGKITSSEIIRAMRNAAGSVDEKFSTRVQTVSQSFVNLQNAMKRFAGEASASTGASETLATAIDEIAKNLDSLASVLISIGAGALAKYIAQTGAAAVVSVRATLETRKQALAAYDLAKAEAAAATATLARTRANTAIIGQSTAITAATVAETAALGRLAAARAGLVTVGSTLLRLLGGPLGLASLVVTAGTALYMFRDGTAAGQQGAENLSKSLKPAVERLQELIDKRNELASGKPMLTSEESETIKAATEDVNRYKSAIEQLVKSRALLFASGDRDGADRINADIDRLNALIKLAEERIGQLSSAQATQPGARNQDADKRLAAMRDELELTKRLGVERAKLQAIQALGPEASPEQKAEAAALAVQIFVVEEAHENAAKAAQDFQKAQEEARNATEANAKVVNDLAQALAFAALSGEDLAAVQAVAKLNKLATPEDVKNVEAYARAVYKADQAERARQKIGDDPDRYILGEVSPLSGSAFDSQIQRYEKEAEAEKARYADQLKREKEAQAANVESQRGYYALEEQMAQQHADRMAQIEQAKMQTIMSAGEQGFGALADIMRTAKGEQSGIYKAMFAASKAFAIAQSIVSITQGIAMAAALPFPANLPAMATVAAATAGLVSTISGTQIAGGRQYGGDVAAQKMYRINEDGRPEIYNAANGQQFLLPGRRGNVEPASSAGGGRMQVNVHNYGGVQVETRQVSDSEADVIIRAAVNASRNDRITEAQEGRGSSRIQQQRIGARTTIKRL